MSESVAATRTAPKPRRTLTRAVIRFAGDSGDGMQVTGEQFTTEAAWAGNDISTLPNFPAEIRAPAGTLFGVSSFQLQFGSQRVYTPGDQLDALVVMNPAALKVHLRDLKTGGILIVNPTAFDKRNLDKAGYAGNPLEDAALGEKYRLHMVDMEGLTKKALEDMPLNAKEKDRCKNFFALGLVSWVYTRPLEPTLDAIKKRFAKRPDFVEANIRALKAGHAFGETAEMFAEHYGVEPAEMAPGIYRSMTGNRALAWGLLAAAERTQVPVVFGAYPITPASDILHELALHKRFRIRTFQAEDEIAAVTAAIDPLEKATDDYVREKKGGRHFLSTTGAITFTAHIVSKSPVLTAFAAHPAIKDICHDLIGDDVRLYWDQSVYKKTQVPQEFPWHQDNGYTFIEPQQYLTLWIPLVDVDEENGCPWIAPGLHKLGTLEHWVSDIGLVCLKDAPDAVAAPARAGDIVVFSSLAPHRTGPNLTDQVRKAYILQYAPEGAYVKLPDGTVVTQDDPARQFRILDGEPT